MDVSAWRRGVLCRHGPKANSNEYAPRRASVKCNAIQSYGLAINGDRQVVLLKTEDWRQSLEDRRWDYPIAISKKFQRQGSSGR